MDAEGNTISVYDRSVNADWASDCFYKVTETDVDADDNFGFETPRELSKSIKALNGGKKQKGKPTGKPADGGSSSY